jgi:hypothetical protein
MHPLMIIRHDQRLDALLVQEIEGEQAIIGEGSSFTRGLDETSGQPKGLHFAQQDQMDLGLLVHSLRLIEFG